MIIDADCHISSHKFDGLAILAGELVDALDRAGVDRALLRDFSAADQAKVLGENIARFVGV